MPEYIFQNHYKKLNIKITREQKKTGPNLTLFLRDLSIPYKSWLPKMPLFSAGQWFHHYI
jgi:hypothetical protein